MNSPVTFKRTRAAEISPIVEFRFVWKLIPEPLPSGTGWSRFIKENVFVVSAVALYATNRIANPAAKPRRSSVRMVWGEFIGWGLSNGVALAKLMSQTGDLVSMFFLHLDLCLAACMGD